VTIVRPQILQPSVFVVPVHQEITDQDMGGEVEGGSGQKAIEKN
jgi:hypothetical protein